MQPQSSGRMFECKTCKRRFPSYQALGGHRASHKKPRPVGEPKPKTHECNVCGIEFHIGQALGGHMSRHRGVMRDDMKTAATGSEVDGKREMGLDLSVPTAAKDNESRLLDLTLALPIPDDS